VSAFLVTLPDGRLAELSLGAGALRADGLVLQTTGDGCTLTARTLELSDVAFRAPGLAVQLGSVRLAGVQAQLRLGAQGWQLQHARCEEADLGAGSVRIAMAGLAPIGELTLDALQGLAGSVEMDVTDAAWVFDARIRLPVQNGEVDFNQVSVQHVGPDSRMGIGHGGLYLDAASMGRRYLVVFTGPRLPGVLPEPGRGRLQLVPWLAALARLRPLPARWANRQAEAGLGRSRLRAELRCGDGWLGAGGARVLLDGQAQGHNRCELMAAPLAGELQMNCPRARATEAEVRLGAGRLRTGAVGGELQLRLGHWWPTGGPPPRPRLLLQWPRLLLRSLQWETPTDQPTTRVAEGSSLGGVS